MTTPLPKGDGYFWTLTSLLGKMLSLAEERFGSRDLGYTLLGYEFVSGIPQCWYPGNRKYIVIQIEKACLLEPDRACFQLAHEAIHILSPSGGRNANVMEEGLAAHFQVWFMKYHYPSYWPRSGNDWSMFGLQSYAEAKGALERLLAIDGEAVKKLRQIEPIISRISADLVLKMFPSIPHQTAEFLGAKFVR